MRNCEIGLKGFDLTYFREAYTSERWIVRIYEVLAPTNRDSKLKTRFSDSKPAALPKGRNSAQTKMVEMPNI